MSYDNFMTCLTTTFVNRAPGGPRSQLEQHPGCGYKQKQMANSCCPLSCQGPEDLSAKCKYITCPQKKSHTAK